MKLQHTPGPWNYEEWADGELAVFDSNGISVCNVHDNGDYEANARLIAASPEMLEALISIQRGMQPYKNESGVINVSLHCWRNLKSAIERATGMTIDEVLEAQS